MKTMKSQTAKHLRPSITTLTLVAFIGFFGLSLFGEPLTQRFLHALGTHDSYDEELYAYELPEARPSYQIEEFVEVESAQHLTEEDDFGCSCPTCCQI
jgi:hypothetical protein